MIIFQNHTITIWFLSFRLGLLWLWNLSVTRSQDLETRKLVFTFYSNRCHRRAWCSHYICLHFLIFSTYNYSLTFHGIVLIVESERKLQQKQKHRRYWRKARRKDIKTSTTALLLAKCELQKQKKKKRRYQNQISAEISMCFLERKHFECGLDWDSQR